MRRTAVFATALLLAGCTGSSTPRATPTPTVTAVSTDPFDAIEPPKSLEVGSFGAFLVNRAYASVRGYLALELLEPDTLLGRNEKTLVEQLQGATMDNTVRTSIGVAPNRTALNFRPLFPAGTQVAKPVGSITSSTYVADEVQGLGGENGLRITWTGGLTYPVVLKGKASTITYQTTVGFVFSRITQDPNGVTMQQPIAGTATFGGVIDACAAKGLLYPGVAGAACPA